MGKPKKLNLDNNFKIRVTVDIVYDVTCEKEEDAIHEAKMWMNSRVHKIAEFKVESVEPYFDPNW